MKVIEAKDGDITYSEQEIPNVSKIQCLVKIHFAGVNRADLLQIAGKYPPLKGASDVLGLEFSGEIVETGAAVQGFKKGDKVSSIVASGAYGEYVAVEASHLIPVPENLTLEQAGGLAEVFITAYQSLIDIAKIQKGEKVLIHAGASGVGSAAIQMAKSVGCKVLCTASAGKQQYCYDLGADKCIDYKSIDFAEEVQEVDMVLDLVGGSYFQKNLQVMAVEGRMVMLGFMGGVNADKVNVAALVTKRLKIFGSTLRARSPEYKTRLIQSFISEFIKDGVFPFKTNIDKVFNFEEATLAHQYMRDNLNKGKILLKLYE